MNKIQKKLPFKKDKKVEVIGDKDVKWNYNANTN
jgi:hypothetical protein